MLSIKKVEPDKGRYESNNYDAPGVAQNGGLKLENCEISHTENTLGTESIGNLILKYSLPAIASSLVSSVYNIADQIFVGNKIGELENAATNAPHLFF